MVFLTSKFSLMLQNLNLKSTTTTPIFESSTRTTSKSITARTRKSIKSCFPTKTRQTRTRSQVSIVSPCECKLVYIGKTGRNLTIRQNEHHNCCVKEKCKKSAIANHAWMCDHRINWHKSVLLDPVDKYFAPKTRESIEISKH